MIHKDHAAAAVLTYLEEDLSFSAEDLHRYTQVLLEAQSFTMKMEDLLTLINHTYERKIGMTEDIQVELPFPSIYLEYTECSKYGVMEDVARCGLFAVGNPENENRPALFMTIHYLSGYQLCPAAAAINGTDVHVDIASRVRPDQKEFVDKQVRAIVSFSGILTESIVNGGVSTYTPAKFRKKLHQRTNKKHKLLEYKILKLDLEKMGRYQEPSGGSHASPRLHLRRGHWRKYKNGAKKWIKPMWVGDKDLGVIQKDYEVIP